MSASILNLGYNNNLKQKKNETKANLNYVLNGLFGQFITANNSFPYDFAIAILVIVYQLAV